MTWASDDRLVGAPPPAAATVASKAPQGLGMTAPASIRGGTRARWPPLPQSHRLGGGRHHHLRPSCVLPARGLEHRANLRDQLAAHPDRVLERQSRHRQVLIPIEDRHDAPEIAVEEAAESVGLGLDLDRGAPDRQRECRRRVGDPRRLASWSGPTSEALAARSASSPSRPSVSFA